MVRDDSWTKYVGLAIRAGAVQFGIDNISSSREPVYLIVMSEATASQNLKKKVDNFIANKNSKLVKLDVDLDEYLHTTNCKVIGITNKNLADQIYSFLKE